MHTLMAEAAKQDADVLISTQPIPSFSCKDVLGLTLKGLFI